MTRFFAVPLAASALLALSCAAHATVHDVVADFSATTNTESSLWSYRTSTTVAHDGAYPLLPNFGPFAGFTGPAAATAGWTVSGVPAIGVNVSGADQFFTGFGPGAEFTWPAGAMFMHPGAATLAVVSWLSPSAAQLSIAVRFSDMDGNAAYRDGVAWSVEKNAGGAALAFGSFPYRGSSGPVAISNVTVAAGDRIHFIVGGNGDFQGDSTRLEATITTSPVPEPAAWMLALAGGVLLLARRRQA
jgi:hypothetical protein